MLRELYIKNLALIDELTLTFSSGLSVMTGETGAGKSIILQSLSLLAGGKGSASWVRTGSDQALIEARFELTGDQQQIIETLTEMGFDIEDELIIKRIVAKTGRSRFYLNGSLATAKTARSMAEDLFSMASQHDHQKLLNPRSHLDYVDTVGNLLSSRDEFSTIHDHWAAMRTELANLQQLEIDKEQRKDFLKFQLQEITDAKIQEGEDDLLEQERNRLKSADDLFRLGKTIIKSLARARDELTASRKQMMEMAALDPSLSSLADNVETLSYQLEAPPEELQTYLTQMPSDPHRLDSILSRLHLLQGLKRKYGPTLPDVINHGQQIAAELSQFQEIDQKLNTLAQEEEKLLQQLTTKAGKLSQKRGKTAQDISKKINQELLSLSFDQAGFHIDFHKEEKLTRTGYDRAEFVFSANPGEPAKPIASIASGGELSRLLLALKCILSRQDMVDTVIFDEVDAGISGKAAEAVARKIKELAHHHQVICITHLPQIASCANKHYQVAKEIYNDRTVSTINLLTGNQKIEALARMLDGNSVTAKTVAYATELINRNQ